VRTKWPLLSMFVVWFTIDVHELSTLYNKNYPFPDFQRPNEVVVYGSLAIMFLFLFLLTILLGSPDGRIWNRSKHRKWSVSRVGQSTCDVVKELMARFECSFKSRPLL
jgi:hypothetical protein